MQSPLATAEMTNPATVHTPSVLDVTEIASPEVALAVTESGPAVIE